MLGIDLSEEMVRATNAEIAQRGVLNARARSWMLTISRSLKPNSMALRVRSPFSFLSDRDAVLSTFHRLLRPGGSAALSIWAEETPTEVARWRWYDDLVKHFLQSSSGSSPLNPGREMDTPEQLAARLTGAGFAEVRGQSETKVFAYTSPEEWWQERWSLFFRVALERLAPEALAALQTEALAHARTMQARGELTTERNAVYVVAKK